MSAQPESYLPEIHRLFPQSADAERGLICSFLLAPREVADICAAENVTSAYFHIPALATIFGALMEMNEANLPIDIITATQFLRDNNRLDQAGGAALITELFTFLPTATNTRHYLGIVKHKYTLRAIIQTATEYASRAYDEQHDPEALLNDFEAKVLAIQAGNESEAKDANTKDLVMEVVHDIEAYYDRRGQITGLTTGFAELDTMLDGLQPSEMIVIAARPSMGKTALAMNIAEHIAIEGKKPVAVFTLEMSAKQLMTRALLARARVNFARVRSGFLAERDFPSLTAAASKIASSQLQLIDCNGCSIQVLRAKARRLKRKYPDMATIVIDYLQLVRSTSHQARGSREREIAEVSAGCKSIAKELGIPVVVLAQLNREVEKRTGDAKGRPKLSDLRESGSIEQDADVIGLLMREEYYAITEEEKRDCQGKALLIVAKNRNGPTGDIPLTFLSEFTRFENRARGEESEAEPSTEQRTWHKD